MFVLFIPGSWKYAEWELQTVGLVISSGVFPSLTAPCPFAIINCDMNINASVSWFCLVQLRLAILTWPVNNSAIELFTEFYTHLQEFTWWASKLSQWYRSVFLSCSLQSLSWTDGLTSLFLGALASLFPLLESQAGRYTWRSQGSGDGRTRIANGPVPNPFKFFNPLNLSFSYDSAITREETLTGKKCIITF